jgi:hypothetical protein
MATKRKTYVNPEVDGRPLRGSAQLGALNNSVTEHQGMFSVYTYAINRKDEQNKGGIEDDGAQPKKHSFPGNISPEGYFYSPFYEVRLKELDDELQSVNARRINFNPATSDVTTATTEFYYKDMGYFEDKDMSMITIVSPITYDFLVGQSFSIYDIMSDITFRGNLQGFSSTTRGCQLLITTEEQIDLDGLRGTVPEASGKSRYIICLVEDYVPDYAVFIPATNKLIWRGPKKMSDLESDSPLYNMPFTNGRLYIHRNLNVFVRRQDPHSEYKLFRPSQKNPLRRFQIPGDAKIDFDYIQYIIDSMVDAC